MKTCWVEDGDSDFVSQGPKNAEVKLHKSLYSHLENATKPAELMTSIISIKSSNSVNSGLSRKSANSIVSAMSKKITSKESKEAVPKKSKKKKLSGNDNMESELDYMQGFQRCRSGALFGASESSYGESYSKASKSSYDDELNTENDCSCMNPQFIRDYDESVDSSFEESQTFDCGLNSRY